MAESKKSWYFCNKRTENVLKSMCSMSQCHIPNMYCAKATKKNIEKHIPWKLYTSFCIFQ